MISNADAEIAPWRCEVPGSLRQPIASADDDDALTFGVNRTAIEIALLYAVSQ